jgi:signal transduction histidine kinase
MGCLFAIFGLFSLSLLLTVLIFVLNLLGLIQFNHSSFPWILSLGVLLSVLLLSLLGVSARVMRRLSTPLDQLLSASERVAQGDYSARVEERGLPEMRSLAQGFNSMASRLETSDRQRRNALADVSHELRTPLTVIQGSVEGMLDGLYPPDEKLLKSILEETHLLSRLVDDLRILSLAESGALQLKREPVDLKDLIEEVVAAHASIAEAAGVELEIRSAISLPMNLDPQRIREILSNLIANAIHFSPRGGRVWVVLDGATVSVEDNGLGIPPADLPHIFDRYFRSSDSGGMGLGLSIARYLVEAHGGIIRADSAAGQGTKITFTLPPDSPL